MFKCKKCDEELESVIELKKHKEEHDSCQEKFQCEECEKVFKENGKLEEHVKRVHTKFECDECDKIFDYEGILERHVEAVHEDVELYCHYFNNNKDCPFGDQCIFLHEESQNCKYGKACERTMCMYKHEDSDGDDDGENTDDEEDEESEDEENAEELKQKLEEVRKSVEKVAVLLGQVNPIFKCQHCDFEAKNQNGLNMHTKSKHNNKS